MTVSSSIMCRLEDDSGTSLGNITHAVHPYRAPFPKARMCYVESHFASFEL